MPPKEMDGKLMTHLVKYLGATKTPVGVASRSCWMGSVSHPEEMDGKCMTHLVKYLGAQKTPVVVASRSNLKNVS